MIERNNITIGISGKEFTAFKEQLLNEFQNKYIKWQGEDNVLVTTVLQRLYDFTAGKVQIILADAMPVATTSNTQYWVKTYDGTTLEEGRFIIMTDHLNNATFIGTSSVDLTAFYTKSEIDTKLTDLTTSNFRNGVIITSIGTSSGNSTIPTGGAVRVALSRKQDTIVASDQLTTPTDTDKLSYVNNVTNNRWTFAKIWDWIVAKLTANTEKGIQVSSGKIGHSNAITVPTAKRILQATYDAQGHVTAIETEFNWSNTYNTSAENQLFTRKGANAMYSALKYNKNNSVIKLCDGLEIHIETGVSVPQTGTQTKNFAAAFPNNCWAVIATPAQPGYGANAVIHASVNSKSQYKISQAGGVAAMGVTIIAFGN